MHDSLYWLEALGVAMMRPYGMLLILPLFTVRSLGSSLLRNGLVFAIALPVTPLFFSLPLITHDSLIGWFGVLCVELLIGVMIGFVAALPFWAIDMAGFLIDTLRGATMSTLFNPHIAKNMVAAGIANEILVQVSYAIGVSKPISLMVNTYGTSKISLSDSEIAKKINLVFDMRPNAIEERLKLRNPIYEETASYGHMGREPMTVTKKFRDSNGTEKSVKVELFTWEKLDFVNKLKTAFKID